MQASWRRVGEESRMSCAVASDNSHAALLFAFRVAALHMVERVLR